MMTAACVCRRAGWERVTCCFSPAHMATRVCEVDLSSLGLSGTIPAGFSEWLPACTTSSRRLQQACMCSSSAADSRTALLLCMSAACRHRRADKARHQQQQPDGDAACAGAAITQPPVAEQQPAVRCGRSHRALAAARARRRGAAELLSRRLPLPAAAAGNSTDGLQALCSISFSLQVLDLRNNPGLQGEASLFVQHA